MSELFCYETFTEEALSDPNYVAEGLGILAVYLSEQSPDINKYVVGNSGDEDDREEPRGGNNPNGECPHGNDITQCTVCNSMD